MNESTAIRAPSVDATDIDRPDSPALKCAESGWEFTERGGACLVKLEVNRVGPPFYARVEPAASGGSIAWVVLAGAAEEVGDAVEPRQLADSSTDANACSRAVSAMLAEVSARIPCVRAALRGGPTALTPAFEAFMPSESTGEQLADMLSALSVACELVGPEIQLLQRDPFMAQLFLKRTNRDHGGSDSRQDIPDMRMFGDSKS